MNVKIEVHKNSSNLEVALERIETWNIPKQVKVDLKRFVNDLGLGKVNVGKRASERTQVKYIDLLKTPLCFLNMPLEKLELKDIENYEKALTSGKIKKIKKGKQKENYATSTQAGSKVALKVFLKWKLGETKAIELAGWLDTRVKKGTPAFLKENEVLQLYKNCKSSKERFLIAVLFDSGARIEEFLNIRFEDIELPKASDNFVKITLKEEYSKTSGRVISLYWAKTTEAVMDYIKERQQEGIKQQEAIYNSTYDAVRIFLNRFGTKVLGKRIAPHLFRHSSATYYASKLNRQQLCYRYGWAFSSDMPDVYISRAGMNNKELDEKFEATEIGELKRLLEQEKIKNVTLNSKVDMIIERIEKEIGIREVDLIDNSRK